MYFVMWYVQGFIHTWNLSDMNYFMDFSVHVIM